MIRILSLVVILGTSNTAFADEVFQNSVKRFINTYAKGNMADAADELFCPKSFSNEKIVEKRNTLVKELNTLTKGLAKIKKIERNKSDSYIANMIACSKKSDYESFQIIGKDVFIVTHEDAKKSVLKLFYISTQNRPALGIVGVGDVGVGLDSIMRQKEMHDQLTK